MKPLTYILFFLPLILFVTAFLFETYLSFARLANPKAGRRGYVEKTWEVTHTLLIAAVVILVMMFSQSIEGIASALFTSTFIAAAALAIRYACYLYIFYVREDQITSWVDWVFAFSHVIAAVALVTSVVKVLWYLYQNNPGVNSQFLPLYLPGLLVTVLICAFPIAYLYRLRK